MADSFSLPEQRAVYSQETSAPVTPQAGMVGGNIRGGLQLRDPSKDAPTAMDHLFAFAVKIGDKKFAEYEAREKDKKFVEGVGRAAAGEAAKDIEAAQPWWARMFGGGDAVAGARAWEGVTDANQMEAAVLSNMQALREVPPAQAQKSLLDIRDKLKSGDPTRDAVQTAMFIKALPGMLKMHAKQHVAFQQEHATEKQRQGVQSAINGIDARIVAARELGGADESDAVSIKAGLAAIFKAPEGVNPDTYNAQVVESMANAVGSGRMSVYTSAREAGLLESMSPQHARQLEVVYERKAREIAAKKTPRGLLNRVAAVSNRMPPEQVHAAYDAINDEFQRVTGLDIPLVPTENRMGMVSQSYQRIVTEAEQAEREANSDAEREAKAKAAREARERLAEQRTREAQEAAGSMAERMLDDAAPDSITVGKNFAAGSEALKVLPAILSRKVREKFDDPTLTQDEVAGIDRLPEDQRPEAERQVLAARRGALIQKEGVPLDQVTGKIKAQLGARNYEAAADVADALAHIARQSGGKEKMPAVFSKLLADGDQELVVAYATQLDLQAQGLKTGQKLDRAQAFAAAELQIATTARSPLKPKDTAAIKEAVNNTPGYATPQAKAMLLGAAQYAFNSKVSGGVIDPHAVAAKNATKGVTLLGDSGVAYLRNADYPFLIQDYGRTPEEQHALDDTYVGKALNDLMRERGIDPESAAVFKRDDPGAPLGNRGALSFLVVNNGKAESFGLDDILPKAKVHSLAAAEQLRLSRPTETVDRGRAPARPGMAALRDE
jgi:hypothetical protein